MSFGNRFAENLAKSWLICEKPLGFCFYGMIRLQQVTAPSAFANSDTSS
jgi:hypothetical protein